MLIDVPGLCFSCGRRSSAVFVPRGGKVLGCCHPCKDMLPIEELARVEYIDAPSAQPEDVTQMYALTDRAFAKMCELRQNDAVDTIALYEVRPDGGAFLRIKTIHSRGSTDYYILFDGQLVWR